jgi:hypothetical protein
MVERIAAGGLIMIEPMQGSVRRVFRRSGELAGDFSEITEEVRSLGAPDAKLPDVRLPQK